MRVNNIEILTNNEHALHKTPAVVFSTICAVQKLCEINIMNFNNMQSRQALNKVGFFDVFCMVLFKSFQMLIGESDEVSAHSPGGAVQV